MEREKAIKILKECKDLVTEKYDQQGFISGIQISELSNMIGIEKELIMEAFCTLATEGELDIAQMDLLVTAEW